MMSSQYNTRPVGTGPVHARHRSRPPRQRFKANPTYHGQQPFLDGLTVRFYPDHQSLMPAYDRGEIDAISWVWPEDMSEADEARATCRSSPPRSRATRSIYLNQQNPNTPFFKDVAVRKALMYGLDRQKLIDTVLQRAGHGRTFADHARQLGLRSRGAAVHLRPGRWPSSCSTRPAGLTATATACASRRA